MATQKEYSGVKVLEIWGSQQGFLEVAQVALKDLQDLLDREEKEGLPGKRVPPRLGGTKQKRKRAECIYIFLLKNSFLVFLFLILLFPTHYCHCFPTPHHSL